MTRLSDDCFAVGDQILSIEDAVAVIRERFTVVAGIETVPLAGCDGRIAAEDIRSTVDLPPFANSAVDGYAVRASDLEPSGETSLPVIGRVAAGAAPRPAATSPGTVRIFTGAPLPPGFDTVVMQEHVRRDGDRAILPPGIAGGANRRLAGEDVGAGSVVIPAGRRLGPPDLALAAALGLMTLPVRSPIRVAVFSTGNELVEPGGVLVPGRLFDSNRTLIAALLRRFGLAVSDLGILPDDPRTLAERLADAAASHDLVLTSGGVSSGDEDHIKGAIERIGSLAFWRLAVKPGRPVALGSIGTVPFVGLPGNPVAVYVALLFLVRPLLSRLSGEAYVPPLALPVRSAFSFSRKAGRREYLRVSLRERVGAVEAVKFPRDGSGILTSLAGSDGLAELPETVADVQEGDILRYFPHALLW